MCTAVPNPTKEEREAADRAVNTARAIIIFLGLTSLFAYSWQYGTLTVLGILLSFVIMDDIPHFCHRGDGYKSAVLFSVEYDGNAHGWVYGLNTSPGQPKDLEEAVSAYQKIQAAREFIGDSWRADNMLKFEWHDKMRDAPLKTSLRGLTTRPRPANGDGDKPPVWVTVLLVIIAPVGVGLIFGLCMFAMVAVMTVLGERVLGMKMR
ncbi:hypothetical protein BDV19DRAFT_390706 [Aspergillus venezuelensis]